MKDTRQFSLPRGGFGPVTWDALNPYMHAVMREVLARFDPRNPHNDFRDGLVANTDGSVTLGTASYPDGRTAAVPTLVSYLDDTGRAEDQRFLWPISVANRNSVQSINTVLTATSDDTSSEIAIASHSVKFDFGSVSYGSGTVSGLNAETAYYVYMDDPDLDGAVAPTYYATTNPDNLIAKGRYYVGYVYTPVLATSSNVTDATEANPIVVTTSAAHGWSLGDTVEFASMPGDFGTNLNGNTYEIIVTAGDKFSIDVDGSGYAAYAGPAGTARASRPPRNRAVGPGPGSVGVGSTTCGRRPDGTFALCQCP